MAVCHSRYCIKTTKPKLTFRSQNCHVRDAGPDDSVDKRQHTQHAWTTAEEYFRSQFFQVVDTAVNQMKVRYDQPGLHQYMQLENALMTADTSADELKSAAYPKVDANRLAVQLAMLRQQNWKLEFVEDVATKLASAQPVVRSMFDQVEQLVRLLLTIPCSSVEAERSFSSLRRLKTYCETP